MLSELLFLLNTKTLVAAAAEEKNNIVLEQEWKSFFQKTTPNALIKLQRQNKFIDKYRLLSATLDNKSKNILFVRHFEMLPDQKYIFFDARFVTSYCDLYLNSARFVEAKDCYLKTVEGLKKRVAFRGTAIPAAKKLLRRLIHVAVYLKDFKFLQEQLPLLHDAAGTPNKKFQLLQAELQISRANLNLEKADALMADLEARNTKWNDKFKEAIAFEKAELLNSKNQFDLAAALYEELLNKYRDAPDTLRGIYLSLFSMNIRANQFKNAALNYQNLVALEIEEAFPHRLLVHTNYCLMQRVVNQVPRRECAEAYKKLYESVIFFSRMDWYYRELFKTFATSLKPQVTASDRAALLAFANRVRQERYQNDPILTLIEKFNAAKSSSAGM